MTLPDAENIAKIARPRTYGAVPRERLYQRLDVALQRPLVWLSAPPGAGKTTLVASYLDARNTAALWYQVDAGDTDIATFFHYLARAAAIYRRGDDERLPVFEAVFASDLAGFARRFFREFFARLPNPCTVVFDNYQDVSPEGALHRVLSLAPVEAPAGQTLLVVSRGGPPTEFARFIANGQAAIIDWEALRLDAAEAQAIVQSRIAMAESDIDALIGRSGGWAAGLTLLIEQQRQGGSAGHLRLEGHLFDYFAGEILDRESPAVQSFLLSTAGLPLLTVESARLIAGDPQAGEVLEGLYRRGLFLQRIAAPVPAFQFHALFREFLSARVAASGGQDAQRRTARLAGDVLESQGMTEEAFLCLREARDWPAMEGLIERHAATLSAQGRLRTLQDWITVLPKERRQGRPWLLYWFATSLVLSAPEGACAAFDQAHELFQSMGDHRGALRTACAQVELVYFDWSDFRPLTRWIQEIERLVEAIGFESEGDELRVSSNLMIAMLYVAPGHANLNRLSERVEALLDGDADLAVKRVAAVYLVSFLTLSRDLSRCARLVDRVQVWFSSDKASPMSLLWWHTRLGLYHYLLGDFVSAGTSLRTSHEIAEYHGLQSLRVANSPVLFYELMNALGLNDRNVIRMNVDAALEHAQKCRNPMSQWHALHARLVKSAGAGSYQPILVEGEEMLMTARQSGMVYLEVLTSIIYGQSLAMCGRWAELDSLLTRSERTIHGTCLAYWHTDIHLMRVMLMYSAGQRDTALALLRTALAGARTHDYSYMFFFSRVFYAKVMSLALSSGIEVDYVRHFIERYGIQPADPDTPHWPWSVRITTLGRFSVVVQEDALEFSGKTPRKVLALLKAIIAGGAERVPEKQLMDALWPDEEGDAAQKSLGVALTRLRKLLKASDAIVRDDQRLSLNPARCWLDLWAFKRLVGAAMPGDGADPQQLLGIAQELTSLYRGKFLPDDEDALWALPARERLRGQFTGLIERLGMGLEAGNQWQDALECYRRGLEVDDLNEALYRGLMRSCHALDRSVDAIAAYRRLRQMLSVTLGMAPSPETEALARLIGESRRID